MPQRSGSPFPSVTTTVPAPVPVTATVPDPEVTVLVGGTLATRFIGTSAVTVPVVPLLVMVEPSEPAAAVICVTFAPVATVIAVGTLAVTVPLPPVTAQV